MSSTHEVAKKKEGNNLFRHNIAARNEICKYYFSISRMARNCRFQRIPQNYAVVSNFVIFVASRYITMGLELSMIFSKIHFKGTLKEILKERVIYRRLRSPNIYFIYIPFMTIRLNYLKFCIYKSSRLCKSRIYDHVYSF